MDSSKIQDFILNHFEKFLLLLIIGGAGYLVYSGMQLPNLLEKRDPDRLGQDANQVRSSIDEDHNEAIIPERIPTFDIVAETKKIYSPVPRDPYRIEQPWARDVEVGSVVRRQDPVLAPLADIRIMPVVTTIAVRSQSESYFLKDLEGADAVERKAPKKRRPPRRSRRGMGMDGMGMDGMGMDEMGMDMGMDMEMEMGMDMDMGMGMESMASGAGRTLDHQFDFGVRPTKTSDQRIPVPAVGWFVAGTALLPHKEIYHSYEFAFKDADGYDPRRRDTPIYFNFEVQRADVTEKGVDELKEEDWKKIWDRLLYTKLAARYWSGFAPEIVHSEYVDSAITTWIPPVLLDDYRVFCTHPKIPKLSKEDLDKRKARANEPAKKTLDFSLDAEEDDAVLAGVTGELSPTANMNMSSMLGGMYLGMGEIESDPVEYKLVRFYDFIGFPNSPEPRRTYVYRVRYSVNDPNFPGDPALQPKQKILSPEVNKRISSKMADAVKNQKRDFQRWADWSAPTEPISLASREQVHVGPASENSTSMWNVADRKVPYQRDSPKVKIVASQFDPMIGTRLPMNIEVSEGSVLSHRAESADVIDPITLSIKKLPDAEIISSSTVIDIMGGAELKIDDGDGMTEPSTMLLFDESGKLSVHSEFDDQELYRIYSFADEKGE